MNICNLFIVTIILAISGICEAKHRGIPRRVRSDPVKREDNDKAKTRDVYDRCMGFPGLVPPQLYTVPDDSDNISLIITQSTQWVLRDISSIPNPFFAESVSEANVYFCLDGDRTLFHSEDSNYTGKDYLSVIADKVDNPTNIRYRGFIWELVSIRDSPIIGNILVDIQLLAFDPCCTIRLVNYIMEHESICDCSMKEDPPVTTLQAVKFVDYGDQENCNGCWVGLFTLCSSPECTDRITSIKINNEVIPLLPLVLTTYIERPP